MEVLTEMKMSILVFWIVKPYGLVGRYQCFTEPWYLHIVYTESQPRIPRKRWKNNIKMKAREK